jgi:hypothetical protein
MEELSTTLQELEAEGVKEFDEKLFDSLCKKAVSDGFVYLKPRDAYWFLNQAGVMEDVSTEIRNSVASGMCIYSNAFNYVVNGMTFISVHGLVKLKIENEQR